MDTDELTDTQKHLIHAGIDVRTADWPDELTEDEPEDDLDERLSWYEKQRQVAEGVEKVLKFEEEGPSDDEVREQKRRQLSYGV